MRKMSSIFEFVEMYKEGSKLRELKLYVELDYDGGGFRVFDRNEVNGIDKYIANGKAYIDRSVAFGHCYMRCLEFARKELSDYAKD